jgi:hypothetical protein
MLFGGQLRDFWRRIFDLRSVTEENEEIDQQSLPEEMQRLKPDIVSE